MRRAAVCPAHHGSGGSGAGSAPGPLRSSRGHQATGGADYPARSTAASSSSINDGAAALVLCSEQYATAKNLKPLARIVAQASFAQAPEWFTTAPVGAIQSVLGKAGWAVADVDLFEINEAFATVAMAPIHELGISHEKVNVNGGACALGHPIGASGARILVTLIHALQVRGLCKGVASLCIGGGEATAMAIELV